MDLKDIGWDCVDWTHVTVDRGELMDLVNTVMNEDDSALPPLSGQ
jgi:hypothetical protein